MIPPGPDLLVVARYVPLPETVCPCCGASKPHPLAALIDDPRFDLVPMSLPAFTSTGLDPIEMVPAWRDLWPELVIPTMDWRSFR